MYSKQTEYNFYRNGNTNQFPQFSRLPIEIQVQVVECLSLSEDRALLLTNKTFLLNGVFQQVIWKRLVGKYTSYSNQDDYKRLLSFLHFMSKALGVNSQINPDTRWIGGAVRHVKSMRSRLKRLGVKMTNQARNAHILIELVAKLGRLRNGEIDKKEDSHPLKEIILEGVQKVETSQDYKAVKKLRSLIKHQAQETDPLLALEEARELEDLGTTSLRRYHKERCLSCLGQSGRLVVLAMTWIPAICFCATVVAFLVAMMVVTINDAPSDDPIPSPY